MTKVLTIDEASDLVESCMIVAGHSVEEARIITDHLIDCELRGLTFGGLPRALSVIEQIRDLESGRRPIEVLRESPVSASLDGGRQVGYLVADRATNMAIEKARKTGLAAVGASKTWYTGMFSYYLERVTRAGFVGMIVGNGAPRVAPHGGTEARFSTNPIAFGFPSESTPVIWDIGTSSVMLGEVVLKKRLGEKLADGLAFDPQGNPTLDPSEALEGAFSVWGGHKGSGLSLVVQLLGMMVGAENNLVRLPSDCGFFIVVIDPELFGDRASYMQKVSEFSAQMRATRPVDPGAPVRVPFERSDAERKKRVAANAIEVADKVFESLQEIAGQRPLGTAGTAEFSAGR
jgi:LDH2 family malate/lactate/ureidoglycolate dehydrogenase